MNHVHVSARCEEAVLGYWLSIEKLSAEPYIAQVEAGGIHTA